MACNNSSRSTSDGPVIRMGFGSLPSETARRYPASVVCAISQACGSVTHFRGSRLMFRVVRLKLRVFVCRYIPLSERQASADDRSDEIAGRRVVIPVSPLISMDLGL